MMVHLAALPAINNRRSEIDQADNNFRLSRYATTQRARTYRKSAVTGLWLEGRHHVNAQGT